MQHRVLWRVEHAALLQDVHRLRKRQPFGDAQRQLAFFFQFGVGEEVIPLRIVLRRGEPVTRRFLQDQLRAAPALRHGGRRNFLAYQILCGLAQAARRLAIRFAINAAARRIGGLLGDAGNAQRRRVRHQHVPVGADEERGMIAGDRIQVLARGNFLHRPLGVVPAASQYPFAGRGSLHALGNARLHLIERFRVRQFDIQHLEAAVGQVQVRVVEAGHREAPAQVHHLRVRAFDFADFIAGADRRDAPVAHRDCLGARVDSGGRAAETLFRAGVNVAMDEDLFGRFELGVLRVQVHGEKKH